MSLASALHSQWVAEPDGEVAAGGREPPALRSVTGVIRLLMCVEVVRILALRDAASMYVRGPLAHFMPSSVCQRPAVP